MSCTVELLSIGNELLLGNTVNTNAAWIAARVTKLGGSVTRITTVGDNLKEISTEVNESLRRRPDFLITTGGIGPTFDDMTLKAMSRALHRPLRVNRAAVKMIRHHYAVRFPGKRIGLTKARLKMATMPASAVPLQNPRGTAPGVLVSLRRTRIVCLPGVPREAKEIFRTSLAGLIKAQARGMRFSEKWLDIQGVMESTLSPIVDKVMRRYPGVYIKSHPRGMEAGRPHIQLHFSTSTSATASEGTLYRAARDFASSLRKRQACMIRRR